MTVDQGYLLVEDLRPKFDVRRFQTLKQVFLTEPIVVVGAEDVCGFWSFVVRPDPARVLDDARPEEHDMTSTPPPSSPPPSAAPAPDWSSLVDHWAGLSAAWFEELSDRAKKNATKLQAGSYDSKAWARGRLVVRQVARRQRGLVRQGRHGPVPATAAVT